MFRYIKTVVTLARPLPTLSILIISLTGSIAAATGRFNIAEVLASFGAIGCIAIAGYIWNDICDVRTDAMNCSRRPIPSGAITSVEALILAVVFVATGWGLALLLSMTHTVLALGMIETISDVNGDRLAGYRTLPVVAPTWISYALVFATYLLTILFSLQRWDGFGVINMTTSLVSASGLMIMLVAASLDQHPQRLRLISKFMNLCLLIWLVGCVVSKI